MCHPKNQKDHNLKVKRLLSNTDSEMNHTYYSQTRVITETFQQASSNSLETNEKTKNLKNRNSTKTRSYGHEKENNKNKNLWMSSIFE